MPPPLSRPTVQTSLFSSWTSLTCGQKGKTKAFTSSAFSPWLLQSAFFPKQILGGLKFHGTPANWLICWRQS